MASRPRVPSPGLLGPGVVVTLPDGVNAYAFNNPADYSKEYISMLLRGDVYGLPFTKGTLRSCYVRFVCNNHPILSIFLADELHPFSRTERLIVNFCYFSWAFFVAGCFANAQGLEWWIVSFVVTAVTLPYSMLLKLLAECGCVQHSRSTCLKGCVEGFGRCILFVFSLLGLLYISLGVTLFISVNGVDKLSSWALSIGQSWLLWFVYWFPLFLFKLQRGRAAFAARFPPGCQAITGYTPGDTTSSSSSSRAHTIAVLPMTPVINPAAFTFAPQPQAEPPVIVVKPAGSPPQPLLTLSPRAAAAASSPPSQARSASPPGPYPGPLPPSPTFNGPVMMAPPAPRGVQVIIPPGVMPGTPLTVMTPEGLAISLVVQPGHVPGTTIVIAY